MSDHLGCHLQGRLFNETISTTVIKLKQRLHLSTQLFVTAAGIFKESSPPALFQLQRSLTQLLNLFPAVHRGSDE